MIAILSRMEIVAHAISAFVQKNEIEVRLEMLLVMIGLFLALFL